MTLPKSKVALLIAAVLLLPILLYLITPSIIKNTIEDRGTEVVGARVDVGGVALSLMPFGLEISDLQVTDPDSPMRNALAVGKAGLSLKVLPLFKGKVISDRMMVLGVRFNTERMVSGEVEGVGRVKREPPKGLDLPSIGTLDIPSGKEDIRRIIEEEGLETLAEAESLKRDLEREVTVLEGKINGLLDKGRIDKYRDRIEGLKGGGDIGAVVAQAGEVLKLKEEIESELKSARSLKEEVERGIKEYRGRLKSLKKMPGKDIGRIKERYSFKGRGGADITALILGEGVRGYLDKALLWYERLKPFVESKGEGGGKVERPGERSGDSLPSLLIRRVDIGVELTGGRIGGRALNITPEQHITGRPVTFDINGKDLKGLGSVSLKGEANHVDPERAVDEAELSLRGLLLKGAELGSVAGGTVVLKEGSLDLNLSGRIDGGVVGSDFEVVIGGARVELVPGRVGGGKEAGSTATEGTKIQRALAGGLEGIDTIKILGEVRGEGGGEGYKISLKSNLDKILGDAVEGAARSEMKRFESRLKKEVNRSVGGPLKNLDGLVGGLSVLESRAAGKVDIGDDLLGTLLKGAGGGRLEIPGGIELPF